MPQIKVLRIPFQWLADALLSTTPNDDMHFELVIDGVQALRFARDGIRLVGRYQINRKITKASVRKVLSAMGKVQALLEWKREVGQIEKRQVSIVDMVWPEAEYGEFWFVWKKHEKRFLNDVREFCKAGG